MLSKNWIQNNLFTKTGNLNNRVCLESWWINRNYIDYLSELQDVTKHLPENSTITERLYSIYNDYHQRPKCDCGKDTTFLNFKTGYRKHCSIQCSGKSSERIEKIQQNTDRQKVQESIRKTNQQRYGVDYLFQTNEFVTQSKTTKLDRYGSATYNNYTQSIETNLKRYGVEHIGQVPEVITKIQLKKSERNPVLRDKDWLVESNKTKSVTEIAAELGVTYRTVYLWFKKFNLDINFFSSDYSKEQNEMYEWIRSITNTTILVNDRNVIAPKELDIYLPEHQLAIEYNGMFWHSGDSKRHIDKLRLCTKKDIKLLQFWDTEWNQSKEIVKSIIKSKLGLTEKIYARKCAVHQLNNNEYRSFLDKNHIQGNINSSIKYGLIFNGEIVSVIGLGKCRYTKKYSHELLRYCNKLNCTVVGGFSKLLNHVRCNHDITNIQTFCDHRFFDGKMYEKSGFSHSHDTSPGYVYYKSGIVKNRLEFQKHKIPGLDKNLTESENMARLGWVQVWDCGQGVFVYDSNV